MSMCGGNIRTPRTGPARSEVMGPDGDGSDETVAVAIKPAVSEAWYSLAEVYRGLSLRVTHPAAARFACAPARNSCARDASALDSRSLAIVTLSVSGQAWQATVSLEFDRASRRSRDNTYSENRAKDLVLPRVSKQGPLPRSNLRLQDRDCFVGLPPPQCGRGATALLAMTNPRMNQAIVYYGFR